MESEHHNSDSGSDREPVLEQASVAPPGNLSSGQYFVDNLKGVQNFHPIVMFGTQGAGKTTILLSLLAYVRYQQEVDVQTTFGCTSAREIFPDDYPTPEGVTHQIRFNSARTIYDDEVPKFENGANTQGTGIREPFFVPISLRKGNEITKFLFVEANGEWYQLDTNNKYVPFKNEISLILRFFDRPISIVFVVPSIQFGGHNYTYILECLGKAMEEYIGYDRGRYGDNILLVGTKRDRIPDSKLNSSGETDISAAEFVNQTKRWGGAWAKFKQMQNLKVASRAAMPYSVGEVKDGEERAAGTYAGESPLAQFPRILWNWLYGNARQGFSNDGVLRVRKVLFPDVDVATLPKPSHFSRAVGAFYGIGRNGVIGVRLRPPRTISESRCAGVRRVDSGRRDSGSRRTLVSRMA